jgi:Hydantoinase B/oxoprolinase
MEQARIALPVLADAKNQASPVITSVEDPEDPKELVADRDACQPKRRKVCKHWQCPRLIADGDQGRALDDDLRRERRQDHDEHRGLTVPQRPHDNAPEGLGGGAPGAAGRFLVNRKTVSEARKMVMQPDDEVTLETPGGGGYGQPTATRRRSFPHR